MDLPLTKRRKIDLEEASPSSSPLTRSCAYDVFLSFRGADTRNNFTGHLHTYLDQKGIKTFIDDEELRIGEEISSALLQAIEGSKISIVIFSQNYASSGWCLDELVKILECKELKQQLVWPVFYKVDPSDVRHQKGKYGEALAKHESRFKDSMDKVTRWRTALRDSANLSRWTFWDGNEAKFISKIVEDISAQVAKRSYLDVARHPVGIESRVQDMLELLDVGGSDVRMVGIWGIGGIGKTTIAKAVFNLIARTFEGGSCFLGNVRENSVPHGGLVRLQTNLLHEILGGRKMKMTHVDRGIQVIKERLGSKRVLLVLDDVNESNQLNNLAGGLDWFGRGSRIIITTRDTGFLSAHQVYAIYKAKALDNDEARKLLILNAFKENINPDECVQFPIDTALLYTHGLPLAVNILGSLLSGKKINQWHDALDSYRKSPNSDIQKVLETSYLALGYPWREAFLDIACFLKGKDKKYVMQALDDSYFNPRHAIEVLEEKALVTTDEFGRIWMHDLLEEMGKEMVHKESPQDAGRRSRLWFHEDVRRILTENTGSRKVKGIRIELPREDEICLSSKCFKKMKNLQLFININARFSGEVNYLPNQLRFLEWPGFPVQSLPSDFNPQKLVKLDLPNSHISRLGEGLKNLQNLKSLNFESCKLLTEVPDLSRTPNLESLNLSSTGLAELHPSVGFLDKLTYVGARECNNLKMFPRIVNMKSLESIDLKGCTRLENFPEIVGSMESLTLMDISETGITELPSSFGYDLFNLKELYLEACVNLSNLPLSIFELKKLENLELSGCPKLELPSFPSNVDYCEVPTSSSNISNFGKATSSDRDSEGDGDDNQAFPSLFFLSAGGCNFSDFLVTLCASSLSYLNLSASNVVFLPAGLARFINLEELVLEGCKNLREVPELPSNLKQLYVIGCVSLERISKLSNILKHQQPQMFTWLDMTNCWRLWDNLVHEAEKEGLLVNNDDHQVEADVLSMFFSSQRSEFGVVLPGSHEIPKWFSCQKDFKRKQVFEIDIQVLPNFKWQNTGLALVVAAKEMRDWKFEVYINEVLVEIESFDNVNDFPRIVREVNSARVWLYYIPFDITGMHQPPPFQCRVRIYQTLHYSNGVSLQS